MTTQIHQLSSFLGQSKVKLLLSVNVDASVTPQEQYRAIFSHSKGTFYLIAAKKMDLSSSPTLLHTADVLPGWAHI